MKLNMRRILQITGLILALATLTGWIATGSNRGWTKTSVERRILDEVTGQEEIRYEKAFLPGLDVLAPALLLSGALAGFSFLFPKRKSTH